MIDTTETDGDRIWWSYLCNCGCKMNGLMYCGLVDAITHVRNQHRYSSSAFKMKPAIAQQGSEHTSQHPINWGKSEQSPFYKK